MTYLLSILFNCNQLFLILKTHLQKPITSTDQPNLRKSIPGDNVIQSLPFAEN